MSIEKLEVFASQADKNTDGITLKYGFPSAEKPARQWFNWLFYTQTSKINEVADLANSNFTRVKDIDLKYEQLKRDTTKQLQDTASSLQDVRDYADQLMQTAVGGKLAYKTYAAMIADKSNIAAKSSIDIIADTDDKNGTYLYDGTNFVKSNYDLEKLIRAKVQNTFGTYDQMVASNLSDGAYALVADDTDDKNGIYIKEGGSWVESKYDALSKTKELTEQLRESLISYVTKKTNNIIISNGEDVLQIVDDSNQVIAKIDKTGDLYLTRLDDSVQNLLDRGESISHEPSIKKLTHAFADNNDNLLFGISRSGGLVVRGLAVDLQEYLGIREYHDPHFEFHRNHLFSDSSMKYLNNLAVASSRFAPCPYGLMPQDYTVPDDIVNRLVAGEESPRIPIDTKHANDDKVVHNHVIEFKELFRGYRYIMCINPYTVVADENPNLYGSNDLNNWELLSGIEQPLDYPESGHYHSDSGLAYDPINGLLICYWRDGQLSSEDGLTSGQRVLYKATRDGYIWSDKKVMAGQHYQEEIGGERGYTSLSVLFNPDDHKWHLFCAEYATIWHYTADDLDDNWVYRSGTPVSGLWHMEVKYVGSKYVVMVNKRGDSSNYCLAISSDGDNWTVGKNLFPQNLNWLYKGSFLTKFNKQGQLSLELIYTTNFAVGDRYRSLFRASTNYIDIN